MGFQKNILSVRKNTPSAFIYKELDTLPLITHRLVRIFKYWLKIVNLPDTCLVKHIYNLMITDMENMENVTNWVCLLKQMLERYGFGYMWNQQHLLLRDDTSLISIFKQRVHDVYRQDINAEISNLKGNRLYKHLN